MQNIIRILLPVLALFPAVTASAQSVVWQKSVEHLGGNSYRILLDATIPPGYHMYDMGPYKEGPNATTFDIKPGKGATLDGGVVQLTKPHRYFDEMFGIEIGTFSGKARFAQRVELSAPNAQVEVNIEWMICNDQSCIPPDDIQIIVNIPADSAATRKQ